MIVIISSISCCSLSSQLIVPVLGDVPDPGQCLVAGLLYDFQVPHLDTRRGEVGDLELDVDGRFPLIKITGHARQEELRLHDVLLPTRK